MRSGGWSGETARGTHSLCEGGSEARHRCGPDTRHCAADGRTVGEQRRERLLLVQRDWDGLTEKELELGPASRSAGF